ncbi:MAG: hypothetical protein ACM3RX_02530, partial [Methanococcaceae archaeon]
MKRISISRIVLLFVLLSGMIFPQAGNYYDAISTSSPSFINDLKARVRSPYIKIDYGQYGETMVAKYASRDTLDGK